MCSAPPQLQYREIMKIFGIIIIVLLSASQTVYSCEKEKKVPDCSEQSWNPSSKNTSSKLKRFYKLDELITQKYKQGDFESTKKLAEEYLALADIYKNNWNYGNAIHDANRILGLLSYQKGEYDEAVLYLSAAGKTSGSPQLDTFGPELDLANLLLKQGKKAEVKSYLIDVQTFWKMDNGIVEEWIEAINHNEKPELTRFGNIRLSTWDQVFNWLLLLWPIIVSFGYYFFYKKKNLSPLKFIPVAILIGYVVSIAASLLFNVLIGYLMGVMSTPIRIPFIYILVAISQLGMPLLVIHFLSSRKKLKK